MNRSSRELRRARLRFAAGFVVIGGAFLALYSFPYAAHGMEEIGFTWYLGAYARAAGSLIHLVDPTVRVSGADLVGRTSLTVAKNCDAMDVNLLLIAAMIAFPARWKRRLVGVVAGVGLLSVANLLRIVALYQINVHAPRAFELIHAELFPLVMVALAVAAFGTWARWSRRAELASPEAPVNAEA